MGKPKKGKKVDTDEEVETTSVDRDVDDEIAPKTKAKKEKNKPDVVLSESEEDDHPKKKAVSKKKRSGDDEDQGEVSSKPKKIKKKKVSESGEDDEAMKKPVVKSAKSKKKPASDSDEEPVPIATSKGGFAALALSDDESEPEYRHDSEDEEEVVEKVVSTMKKDDKKGSAAGGKRGKKKKRDEDEEDLDKILAELQLEYTGEAPPEAAQAPVPLAEDPKEGDDKKKKKKKKDKSAPAEDEAQPQPDVVGGEEGEEGMTVKSAAQKKKEKKEREKQKKLSDKAKAKTTGVQSQLSKEGSEDIEPEPPIELEKEKSEEPGGEAGEDSGDDDDKKKKKKKKKGKEEKEEKGKPKKKAIAAMQEALKKIKEEEEKLKAEEEEMRKKEEEAEQQRVEQLRLEQEKKERKKQKEKEKKERLKAEGKLLNSKQKADRARAQALLEAMKAMRVDGAAPAPKPKPFVRLKKNKPRQTISIPQNPQNVQVEIVDIPPSPPLLADDEPVKDSWDIESDDEPTAPETKSEEDDRKQAAAQAPTTAKKQPALQKSKSETTETASESESDSEEESGSESESESESDDEHDKKKSDAQRKKERAIERIRKRQEDAEKKRSVDELRAAVVCVLGHVDTGKTKILDKLRRTNVQDGEAGGITQQIGATNVPIENIKENCRHVKGFSQLEIKIPGLLIIDTPGHESFSNLRSRGSSLCDIAILVVDIMHGLEPQTIESLNMLKDRKTPFVVALNKIDRLYDWQTMNRKDVRDIIKAQASNTQMEFEQRTNEVILQFAEQGMNAALFYNNPDVRSYVSLVPTSAVTGEGMGNLLALIVESCQTMLAKRLMFSEELQATVLEVKAISGLGTTIDVILVNGTLKEGDTAILAGTDAPIVTQIRSLLMPQPMKELRVKNAYIEYKEIKAAQGVKIAAKDLEKVIAGLNLRVANHPDEVEILKEEVAKELKHALSSIKMAERGVYVQASTLGSLEALLEFLRTSSIPVSDFMISFSNITILNTITVIV